ncbi:Zinc finger protein ZXDC [Frankliniella fusca]|uniref:Zinc finger protein ZXDC n=1 Tax=Frankliniella fusca TaxID=407009 RepID=A0AAE1HWT1_9NEOP|nr:Zinc finger protein ZXDC [Frankliniella fusca]
MAYICKTASCLKKFSSISSYWDHSKIHSPKVFCPRICIRLFSTKDALKNHLSRDHEKPRDAEPAVDFMCPVGTCGVPIKSRKGYLNHMPKHIKEGHRFVCAYRACSYKPQTINQFRVHVNRKHTPAKTVFEVSSGVPSTSSGFSPSHSSASSTSSSNNTPGPQASASTSHCEANSTRNTNSDQNLHPDEKIKDEYAKFYLRLEGEYILPTSTVQVVAEQIQRTTELSHYRLKRNLENQLKSIGLEQDEISTMISEVFSSDPVYNIHHKRKDFDQLGTHHLRQKYWKSHYPYVEPIEVPLGVDSNGRKRCAHLFPLRESLTTLLKDSAIKEMVLQSFKIQPQDEHTFTPSKIFSDFTDGSAFADHMRLHPGKKCILLFMFQDGFDFGAFGPSQGVYKPLGFYYTLGNIKPEYRTKLGCIQLLYLVLEKYFKTTMEEDLNEVDKIKEILQPLLHQLDDLKENGIDVDGEIVPVCLMFGLGDNAGQHFIGRYVQCFTATHCCRFCPISLRDFKDNPTMCEPFRTPREYDEAVEEAKRKWNEEKEKALEYTRRQKAKKQNEAVTCGSKSTKNCPISKNAHKKLTGVHHKGVKYMPSPLNSDTFHVSNFSLCVCLGHDLFEGIVKNTLPAILKNLSEEKKWFDLDTLNKRIKYFTCEGGDKNDAPTPLKSFDSLGGNASENWTLLRVLPFIMEDFVEDKEDEMWCLYLQMKEIVELVTAPKISLQQVLYLKLLIKEYLEDLAGLLPDQLVLKQHLLMHYPDFITKWGPLVRLFTLRFESKHVFFKNVAKACKNYINITYTLARKYACKFALDHSDGLLPPDISFDIQDSTKACHVQWSEEQKSIIDLIPNLENILVTENIEIYGVHYRTGELLQLGLLNICDLEVGIIEKILVQDSISVLFLLELKTATNSYNGYYQIDSSPSRKWKVITYEDLIDHYPIPVYKHGTKKCFVLKHSAPFVLQ